MIGKMLCVKAELISTRLLSEDDKNDMVQGLIEVDSLVTAVKVWMSHGMQDYANGSYERYKPQSNLPMQRYRGLGKNPV
jgi:hypothetical protein